jgi:competence protein ComFC
MEKTGQWFNHPVYTLYHLCWNAVDWLYPPTCGGCNKFGERWCQECQNQVSPVGPLICNICGNFIPSGVMCPSCSAVSVPYEQLRSWGIFFGPLREAIHRLKYKHDLGLGDALAKHLIDLFLTTGWNVDLIVPVPLNQSRLKERGYNQAALLARPLGLATGISYHARAVARIRNTRSQVGLKAKERAENVKDAFLAEPAIVKGKQVLMVDDVTTTGATISACAKALKAAGARSVYGLTLARSSFGLEPAVTQEPDK